MVGVRGKVGAVQLIYVCVNGVQGVTLMMELINLSICKSGFEAFEWLRR